MFERTIYISILLGFFILSGIGIYFGNPKNVLWTDWITEKGRCVIVLANLLFLVLAFRQLFVWNVQVEGREIHLNRFLGLKKIVLEESDFISFTVELDKDPWWMKHPKTTIIVKIQTIQGKTTFNSSDYKSFDNTLTKLFSQNRELRVQCFRQISKLKAKSDI
ncbi:hypothetical protein [Fluviicola sp.]|uniref:hypothetical protein n=1 Tax=Fluviicola sp. TaxID=1917219 RepID=UPI003D2DA5E7